MATGDLEQKCKKTIEHLRKELTRLRTGRANSSLLDTIQVEYYGSYVPILQMGLINSPEPRVITVQVYDASAIDAVEKAIRQSELGLNPSRDGSMLRIIIPALNDERRKEMLKLLNKIGEEAKVGIRGNRRDEKDIVKASLKSKEISEDESRKLEQDIQKITDRFEKEIDDIVASKSKEISEV